jgi:hypothetical protein
MGEMRNAQKMLIGNLKGRDPLGRPRRGWEDNIKMDLKVTGCEGVDWIYLAWDRGGGGLL